ncbi:sensor histidine kinase [Rhizobium herbae]|uniref:histidine kinase n=1 Tax=Rhizobium herbae TaxID=508661 RepID=A0ABS4EPJ7_9HYPH|nr:sensor histidine kinase [Rhizobium herbae]MBP1859868.1 two-component system sensor histidine kinase TctE [Rhizobium herbae]
MTGRQIEARSGRRLAVTLGLWTLPALIVGMTSTLWFSATTINELADSAYDRSLAGAIRAIDANISTESGGVGVEQPYQLFKFFELTAQGAVYFNVTTDDGFVQIGDVLLPPPPELSSGEINFSDDTYLGRTIRVGSLKRPLSPATPEGTQIIIQVAETKGSRTAFQNELISRAILRDIMVILALVLLLAAGAYAAVKPLNRLREAIDTRDPDDLTPVEVASLPLEVRPLVEAVNRLMQRNVEQADQQRRFLDDASHQLRTPMAIMRTQLDVALHQQNLDDVRKTLLSSRSVLDRSVRTTNQLLALARARTSQGYDAYPQELISLEETIADTVRMLWSRIRSQRMDCVFEPAEVRVVVRANEGLLQEALVNILDNAVAYAPPSSLISIRLRVEGDWAFTEIIDEGPGMNDEEIAHAGSRFRRGSSKRSVDGSGLGLAIALTVARAFGGTMTVCNRPDRSGLVVTISLPVISALPG